MKSQHRGGREREGDGIYNIYVSSAIRRCLLASPRRRTPLRRRRKRIMVTSAERETTSPGQSPSPSASVLLGPPE